MDYKKQTKAQLIQEIKKLHNRLDKQKYSSQSSQGEAAKYQADLRDIQNVFYKTDLEGNIKMISSSVKNVLGYEQNEVIGKNITEFYKEPEDRETFLDLLNKDGQVKNFEVELQSKDGRIITVIKNSYLSKNGQDRSEKIEGTLTDITFHKNFELVQNIIIDILEIFHNNDDLSMIFKDVTALMQRWSGCDAVGIRLEDEGDYPYYETKGFPEKFVELENTLCAKNQEEEKIRDSNGNPVLECMCGNVIYGRYDPDLPFFTEYGSFWTNSTTELLSSTDSSDLQSRTRNRCNGEGYESVALIPLRHNDQNLGLLQFNNKEPGQFDLKMIKQLEQFASSLSLAIAEHQHLDELIDSEKKFFTLFNNLTDAAIVHKIDLDSDLSPGKIELVNESACKLTGYSKEELRSMTPWDLEIDRVREDSFRKIARQIKNKGSVFFESQIKTKHNEIIDIEVNSNIFHLKDQTFLLAVIRDISDRKRMEKELQKSKEKYQALYENAPLPYQSLDKDGIILDVNPKWLRTLGYVRHEVVGHKFIEFIHPDCSGRFKQNFQLFIREGEIHDAQFKLKHKEGHYIDASFEGYVSYDSSGKIDRSFCVFKDITEQKRLEQSLDHVENRYRHLIQASTNHMFMLTTDGFYMLSNDRVQHFGLEKGSQLVGRHVIEVHDLEVGELYQQKIDEVLETKKSVTFEHSLQTKKHPHYHSDTLYPLIDDNDVWAIGGICRDITEKKLKEIEIKEREAELSTILQNVPVILATIEKKETELRVFQVSTKQIEQNKASQKQFDSNHILNCIIDENHKSPCIFGKNDTECIIKKLIYDTFETKESHILEEVNLSIDDDTEVWYLISTVLFEYHGETRVLLSMFDITERKISELQLKRTMQYLADIEENFRQKAAQQLHDQVGQNLTALTFNIDFIRQRLSDQIGKNLSIKFEDSLNLLNDTIALIRNIITEMRPSVLKDYGLFAAINWYSEKFTDRTGINVEVKGQQLSRRLPDKKETILFRIIQELFNNTAKYSEADRISTELNEDENKIYLNIRDDGIGFDKEQMKKSKDPTGLGILSMEDRVNALGGEFELKTAPGQGTKIRIILEK
mgnify:FL=1